jgi:hypothetical protein
VQRYGHGTPDDWPERHVYGMLPWQGVGLLLLADVAMFGLIGLTVWGVQMLWIPVTATGIVNGIGHYLGYRSFNGPTATANFAPWGVVIGGMSILARRWRGWRLGASARNALGCRRCKPSRPACAHLASGAGLTRMPRRPGPGGG